MEDAMRDALNTIENQVMKEVAKAKSLEQQSENYELVRAGMTIFAFALGRLDTIASSLESIARQRQNYGNAYDRGYADGVNKGHGIGVG